MKGMAWHLRQKLTPMRFGALGTLAVFVGVYWLGRQPAPGESGETRASEFWSLPLNSMGDALAGLAASLAFLWLIVTAFIQKNELKEQRAALEAQRDELELAREVQGKQLKAMEAQADIFRGEQKQRAEGAARRVLFRHLEQLVIFTSELKVEDNVWARIGRTGTPITQYEAAIPTIADQRVLTQGEATLGLAVRQFCKQSVRLEQQLLGSGLAGECERQPELLPEHLEISLILNRILQLSSDLSEDDNIWLESLWLEQAAYAWSDLVGSEEIWSNMP
ncbi:hypothetical protein PSM7751_02722 [Pseudooceanicola marinus]|uniref:Uncharacterized protein n=2 Tax=Pseudooceanicola marinus TaxID=396013 RepID=A0A1X6ZM71_9RHOB|nr:hypothetical protein PSM7751_02722 [Pseudooceanicola marinus]